LREWAFISYDIYILADGKNGPNYYRCHLAIDAQFPMQCDVPTKMKNWEYRWTHNEQEIDFNDLNRQKQDGKLVITMRQEYSGSYICEAKSSEPDPKVEYTRYNLTTAVITDEFLMHPIFVGNVSIPKSGRSLL